MKKEQGADGRMNDARTGTESDAKTTQGRSGPVRYELVSYRGEIFGPYATLQEAAQAAKEKWPDQEQDEDRTGAGWDIQVAGVK